MPLVDSAKSYIAWKSIVDQKGQGQLNLDDNQVRQATESRDKAQQGVNALLADGYHWALVPECDVSEKQGKWEVGGESLRVLNTAGQLGSTGTLAGRVASALQREEILLEAWSPMLLKRELDRWFWSQGLDHISVKKLWEENLTRYLYLPRLRDREVFTRAVQEGATSRDFFGYAVGYEGNKYVGLSFGQRPASILLDERAVIVRQDVAEAATPTTTPEAGCRSCTYSGSRRSARPAATESERDHATLLRLGEAQRVEGVPLAPARLATKWSSTSQVLSIQTSKSSLRYAPRRPAAIPDTVVRAVSENAQTLKFQAFEFEEE